MLRHSLRDLLSFVIIMAISLGWYVDRHTLREQCRETEVKARTARTSLVMERKRRRVHAGPMKAEQRRVVLWLADQLETKPHIDPLTAAKNLRLYAETRLSLCDVIGADEALKSYSSLDRQPSRLHYVYLFNSDVSDIGMRRLSKCKQLHFLDLGDCDQVTDATISMLIALPNLRKVNLIGTQVTTAGAARLKKAKPNCSVIHDARLVLIPPAVE